MYRSFLVRVWFEDEWESDEGWKAEIQQIQSGESWSFGSREALLAFFKQLPEMTAGSAIENQSRE